MHTNQIVRESPSWPFSQAERRSIMNFFSHSDVYVANLETFKAEITMFFSVN